MTADNSLIVTEEMTDDDIVTELLDKNNNCFFSKKWIMYNYDYHHINLYY